MTTLVWAALYAGLALMMLRATKDGPPLAPLRVEPVVLGDRGSRTGLLLSAIGIALAELAPPIWKLQSVSRMWT